MVYNKKEFYGGISLLVVFFLVLFMMFQPIYHGHNGMQFLDNLYNSISKGSINYSSQLKGDMEKFNDKAIDVTLNYGTEAQAAQSAEMFIKAGAQATAEGKSLHLAGSLGALLKSSLDDAQVMYDNDGEAIEAKYGIEPRRVLYNWWTSYKLMNKALGNQKEFAAAKAVDTVQTKSVEASYNYFGVEAQSITDDIGLVIFSLVFYVLYTLWYGFAILFLFEGWGLKLSH
jgi:preprotein translocase subunit YajC